MERSGMRPSCDPFLRNVLRVRDWGLGPFMVFDNLELCAGAIPAIPDAEMTLYPHGND